MTALQGFKVISCYRAIFLVRLFFFYLMSILISTSKFLTLTLIIGDLVDFIILTFTKIYLHDVIYTCPLIKYYDILTKGPKTFNIVVWLGSIVENNFTKLSLTLLQYVESLTKIFCKDIAMFLHSSPFLTG